MVAALEILKLDQLKIVYPGKMRYSLQDKIEVLEATVKKLADRVTLLEKPSKPTLPTPAPPPPPPPTTPENPKPPKAESKSVKVK
jgi:hypothetical protein